MNKSPILIQPSFLKKATDLPKNIKSKLLKVMNNLSNDCRHPGLQTKKIKGNKNSVYECRLDDNYRLIYDVIDKTLRCWYIGPHDEALEYGEKLNLATDTHVVDDITPSPIDDNVNFVYEYIENDNLLYDFVESDFSDIF